MSTLLREPRSATARARQSDSIVSMYYYPVAATSGTLIHMQLYRCLASRNAGARILLFTALHCRLMRNMLCRGPRARG
jgi:hypothetical protein